MEDRLEDQVGDLLSIALNKEEEPEVQVLAEKANNDIEVDTLKSSFQFLADYSRLLLPQLIELLPDLVMAGLQYWQETSQSRQGGKVSKPLRASSSSASKSSKKTTGNPQPISRALARAISIPPKKNLNRTPRQSKKNARESTPSFNNWWLPRS